MTTISYIDPFITIADGGLEDMKFYGYGRLEWSYDLKYGSIKHWLEAA